ncbi:MAG: ribosomal-processing cysteine protease Prp, partial [Clostridia bacterium]|nr:ribosomal-processing cysteine protease Prp [Clostridia bacterium]
MTQVRFYIDENRLTGFEISGHSCFALKGSDIVCAAISSAAIMAANTITEVIGDRADISEKDGYLNFRLIDSN